MMLETLDEGNVKWLLKKREIASSYYMESEETSRKRKSQEEANEENEIIKRSEAQNLTGSSFDQKRRRFTEESTNMEEGYHHHHNHMSLDLELNLSPSLRIDLNHQHDLSHYNKNCEEDERKKQKMMDKGSVFGLQTEKRSMSMVPFDLEGDDGCNREGEEEMVARVCMKCHMLVMFCKALPVCPNCKFMHSPEDTSLSLIFTPKPSTLLA